jgi:hypothetical protein
MIKYYYYPSSSIENYILVLGLLKTGKTTLSKVLLSGKDRTWQYRNLEDDWSNYTNNNKVKEVFDVENFFNFSNLPAHTIYELWRELDTYYLLPFFTSSSIFKQTSFITIEEENKILSFGDAVKRSFANPESFLQLVTNEKNFIQKQKLYLEKIRAILLDEKRPRIERFCSFAKIIQNKWG